VKVAIVGCGYVFDHYMATWAKHPSLIITGVADRDPDRIRAVTEYYGLRRIAARQAWYVIGSDVLGPMGHELIPLATPEDADEFLRDHAGKRILRFEEVTAALLADLDAGRWELD
jgi:hypothetical protein